MITTIIAGIIIWLLMIVIILKFFAASSDSKFQTYYTIVGTVDGEHHSESHYYQLQDRRDLSDKELFKLYIKYLKTEGHLYKDDTVWVEVVIKSQTPTEAKSFGYESFIHDPYDKMCTKRGDEYENE
tara:strand:- start:724 stop:1104 length:381 start_codon:yes stop_codon:yes gene_type:complete